MNRTKTDHEHAGGASLGRILLGITFCLVALLGVGLGVVWFQDDGVERAETSVESAEPVEVTAPIVAENRVATFETETVPERTEPEPEPVAIEPAVLYADAESNFHAGAYPEAMRLFTIYVGQHPSNVWAHYMLGMSSWKAGHLSKADTSFTRALELRPNHWKSLLNLTRVRLESDDLLNAVDPIARALKIDPESGEAHRLMGRVLHNYGRIDEAIASYEEALSLDENDPYALNNLGLILIEAERFEEALPPLARAASLRPDLAYIHNNLGTALERTGCFRTAVVAYDAALKADTGYEKARVNRERADRLVAIQERPDPNLASLANRSPVPIEPDTESTAQEVTTGDRF